MTAAGGPTSDAAGRYASALFALAKEEGALDAVERDLAAFREALDDCPDLRRMTASPVHAREEQGRALADLADAMGLGAQVKNALGLMAANRRLFAVDRFLDAFAALAAAHRGEVTAEVAAARRPTDAQAKALAAGLKAATGREVKLNVTVDEGLIGGLVVTVGSRMIDTSIRAKLAGLQNAMREAG